jgi:D-alanyl-D-alanine endopeptidase (penicillin-binding protein 7)
MVPEASAQTTSKPGTSTAKKPAVTAKKKPAPKRSAYSARRAKERQATLARARAEAQAREIADAAIPRYKVDESGDLVPDLRAEAAIIYDPTTGQVIWEENSQSQRSIASITKVMTAAVFLESDPDFSRTVTIVRSDVYRASTTHLRAGDKVTVNDLMHLLLIASDNAAARAIARISPLGSVGFINRMNEKAEELNLRTTHYTDPSGLLADNLSSAYDMARLITLASENERLASIMRKPNHTAKLGKRTVTFKSTNHLLGREDFDVMAGKTGFISKSGYCLATLLRLPGTEQQVAVVVLGARSNAARFNETQNLFNWLSSKASTLFATKSATLQE